MINNQFISFSAVQICDLSFVHLHSSPSTGILRTHNVTSSQMAQLVEYCTGIADVMGSKPVQVKIFFKL